MNKRILILDDDAGILDVMEQYFIYEGFEPFITESAHDFLKTASENQPDLIVVDYSLNGTNGGAICTQLKNSRECAHIPVIIFSGYANKGFKKGSFGCDDFITKPFDMDDLVARIKLLTVDIVKDESVG